MSPTFRTLPFFLLCVPGTILMAQAPLRASLVSGSGPDNSEGARMVCDGYSSTKWCIDEPEQMPYTVILDVGSPTSIAEYGLTTGNDTQRYPERNPVSWRVEGSNDQTTWTLLDEQKANRTLIDADEQEFRFSVHAKDSCRFFRFVFSHMAGGTRIQLGEISLYTTARQAIQTKYAGGTQGRPASSARRSRSIPEDAAMACDGRFSTKWCIDEPQQMPYSIILDAGCRTSIAEYGLVTGDDTHSYPGRNPITWRVEGSNDQQNWTLIDEQKYNLRMRDENEQEYRFRPSVDGSFRYYRFLFLRMADGTRLQLGEIRLY